MLKIFRRFFATSILLVSFFLLSSISTGIAHAQTHTCAGAGGSCVTSATQCANISGTVTPALICGGSQVCCMPGAAGGTSVFGVINPPQGVDKYNAQVPGADGIGIIIFASNIIKLVTIVAGLIVFINFILAGYNYITADGNASAHEKARNQITMSVVGLILIVMAYTITALISLFVFGDAGYILNPVVPTAP